MKRACILVATFALVAVSELTDAARILAFLPFPAKSHLITFTALTRGLAEGGHEITLVCAFPQDKNHPNQKVIAIGDSVMNNKDFNGSSLFLKKSSNGFFKKLDSLRNGYKIGATLIEHVMEQPEVQEILKKPIGTYDAIILEPFFHQESLLALGHKFQAPIIAVHPHGDIADVNYLTGTPMLPSYKPHPYMDFADEMSLMERFQNLIFTLISVAILWYSEYPTQQYLVDKYFPKSPPIWDLLPNVALTVFNSHPVFCYPSPIPPNVVFAGGMHINSEVEPLPNDLQKYVDGATDGLIYFSMGTVLRASDMTDDQKSAFLEAFRLLKQRVLVKWNAPSPANLPSNVRLQEWIPQGAILAHPNTRLFITHGGLLSTQEAVFHGVPVIGIPKFADQKFNLQLARRKGYGIEVDLDEVSKEKLQSSIEEMLNNPGYAASANKLSKIFRDQPIKPLNNAVFWVEHVLRHGGDHLKPASLKLKWYQYLLLDIAGITLSVVVMISAVCIRCLFKIRKRTVSVELRKNKKTN